jgi:hypothetical protein
MAAKRWVRAVGNEAHIITATVAESAAAAAESAAAAAVAAAAMLNMHNVGCDTES